MGRRLESNGWKLEDSTDVVIRCCEIVKVLDTRRELFKRSTTDCRYKQSQSMDDDNDDDDCDDDDDFIWLHTLSFLNNTSTCFLQFNQHICILTYFIRSNFQLTLRIFRTDHRALCSIVDMVTNFLKRFLMVFWKRSRKLAKGR